MSATMVREVSCVFVNDAAMAAIDLTRAVLKHPDVVEVIGTNARPRNIRVTQAETSIGPHVQLIGSINAVRDLRVFYDVEETGHTQPSWISLKIDLPETPNNWLFSIHWDDDEFTLEPAR